MSKRRGFLFCVVVVGDFAQVHMAAAVDHGVIVIHALDAVVPAAGIGHTAAAAIAVVRGTAAGTE